MDRGSGRVLDERRAIRFATPADAGSLAAIYNPYVTHTFITFEERPVDVGEMKRRIVDVSREGVWLVAESQGRTEGYAYARPWHARSAYRHSVESTIYLHPDAMGHGLGTRLYQALLDELASRSVRRVVGVIALPNAASVALHERLGFEPAGRLPELGRKLGRWIDVGYWSRRLPFDPDDAGSPSRDDAKSPSPEGRGAG